MEPVAWCVSGGYDTDGSGCGNVSGLEIGGGDGDGEWSGVIGVVGILLVDVGSSNYGGELSRSLENRLLITWLISSKLSSSTYIAVSFLMEGVECRNG